MSDTRPLSPDEIERNIHHTRARIEDTLASLQEKLSPGELLDHVVHFARENGSSLASNSATMASNAGRAVRDNPIPLALLGVGLAWLMIGERRTHSSAPFPRDPQGPSGGRAGDMAQAAGDNASEAARAKASAAAGADRATAAGSTIRARAGEAAATARQRAEDAASTLRSGTGDVWDRATEAASTVRERAGDLGESARNRVADFREAASERAVAAQRSVGEAAHATRQFATDHPLATGAMMLAAGAVLAALLPRSRTEDRWIGEQSDRAKDRAERTADEMVDRAADAARAAVSEMKSKAEEKGLTADEAKSQAAAVAEAGSDVAVSAARAARREFSGNSGPDDEDRSRPPSGPEPAASASGGQRTTPQKD